MSGTVFVAVLFAALLHASWNAYLKGGDDKTVGVLAMALGHLPFAALALLFVPWPALESVPWMLSSGLIHTGYCLFLAGAYRHGDLSHVYPIARGVAPLIVTGVSVGFLGTVLGGVHLLGIAAIALGLISLALVQRRDAATGTATRLALATGAFIAAYSLNDGIGARLSGGSPVGFYALASVVNVLTLLPVLMRREPGVLGRTLARPARVLLAGGGSFVAYAIVVWAFTQAPIPLVTALRETSIVFAVAIGVLAMHEKLSLAKLAATFVTLAGAAAIRLAR